MQYKLYVSDRVLIDEALRLVNFTQQLIITRCRPEVDQIYLQLDKQGLAIITNKFKPLYVDKIYTDLSKRYITLNEELLIKTVKAPYPLKALILDLTAGWAKDASIFATFGYRVLMLEQNPLLATIINYALDKSYLDSNQLNIIYTNSIEYLNANINTVYPVIYLDPMFQDDKIKSLSNKYMQIIKDLVKRDIKNSDQDLLLLALDRAQKVVVKRDNKQRPLITSPLPTYSKQGKTIRYDIYITSVKLD